MRVSLSECLYSMKTGAMREEFRHDQQHCGHRVHGDIKTAEYYESLIFLNIYSFQLVFRKLKYCIVFEVKYNSFLYLKLLLDTKKPVSFHSNNTLETLYLTPLIMLMHLGHPQHIQTIDPATSTSDGVSMPNRQAYKNRNALKTTLITRKVKRSVKESDIFLL